MGRVLVAIFLSYPSAYVLLRCHDAVMTRTLKTCSTGTGVF